MKRIAFVLALMIVPSSVQAQDPYNFGPWLNGVRASYGLAPVGYDPNLAGYAATNSNAQAARRQLGHFGPGGYATGYPYARRENAGMGNYASMGAMWMNSPAHRAALLDPTIRWYGIASLGAYWTFSAR